MIRPARVGSTGTIPCKLITWRTDAYSSISSQFEPTKMTLGGLRSRLFMLPKVLDIALRSLWTGIYVRPAKYLKFNPEFDHLLATRDPSRGATVTQDESYTIYSSVLATARLPGSIAELGVYQGSTARLMAETKNSSCLTLSLGCRTIRFPIRRTTGN